MSPLSILLPADAHRELSFCCLSPTAPALDPEGCVAPGPLRSLQTQNGEQSGSVSKPTPLQLTLQLLRVCTKPPRGLTAAGLGAAAREHDCYVLLLITVYKLY